MSEAVRRRCADHVGDERELRSALVEDLRALVPFQSHVWLLVDPETQVGTAPLATVPEPLVAELPAVIRRRYLTELNRWDTIASVESLDRATGGNRERSLFHREVLAPVGIGDVASISLRDAHGCWGFLELWRTAGDRSFSDDELDALAGDVESITAALRRCQARSFDRPGPTALPPGPAVLFLSPELRVIGQTPDTDGYLRALLPTEADRRPVPAGAFNVAAALVAAEAGTFPHPPTARVRPPQATWLTFAASRVDAEGPHDEQDIAVTITASSPAERLSLYVRAHGLSHREVDVVDRLVGGDDTRAIAEALFVSEHTVQDHLKSIFAKTGARNRAPSWRASTAAEPRVGPDEPHEPGMGTRPGASYGRRMPTLHIDHAISDLTVWRGAFDPLQEVRRQAGVVHEQVRQPVDDPHRIVVDLDFDTLEHAEAFLELLETKIWSTPANAPALVGSPDAIILDTVLSQDLVT